MALDTFSDKDFWRAIIIYGRNTATYKIALGRCLADFVDEGKTRVSMAELATKFFDLYSSRLENGRPQLILPNRMTAMERIVALHRSGKVDRDSAIRMVEREAFTDVIPRFHTVNDTALPVKFYDISNEGLVLTDSVFKAFEAEEGLITELESRWDLLEAAFDMSRRHSDLINDIRQFYLAHGYERTNLTMMRPVLNGYQNSICFYCGEKMAEIDVHVDHLIPRQLVQHDEIWNLVLAHGFCNQQKSDALPSKTYVEKLIERNEHLIASNHPIKKKLIQQLGASPTSRRKYIYKVYEDARIVIGYTWEGIRGYNPSTDEFYKTYVRSLIK